jgi:alanyl-tRNA synthetase
LGGKGGGGRADLAQGGAPSLENWEGAMQAARSVIQTAVGRA